MKEVHSVFSTKQKWQLRNWSLSHTSMRSIKDTCSALKLITALLQMVSHTTDQPPLSNNSHSFDDFIFEPVSGENTDLSHLCPLLFWSDFLLHSHSESVDTLINAIHLVVGLIGFVLNALVLVTVICNETLHQYQSTFLIASMTVSGMLTSGGIIVLDSVLFFVYRNKPLLYHPPWLTCNMWTSLTTFACISSSFNIPATAIDRYIEISQPLHYNYVMTNRRMALLVAGVWLMALALTCIPLATTFEQVPYMGLEEAQRFKCTCRHHVPAYITGAMICMAIFMPAVILVMIYSYIYRVSEWHRKTVLLHQVLGRVIELSVASYKQPVAHIDPTKDQGSKKHRLSALGSSVDLPSPVTTFGDPSSPVTTYGALPQNERMGFCDSVFNVNTLMSSMKDNVVTSTSSEDVSLGSYTSTASYQNGPFEAPHATPIVTPAWRLSILDPESSYQERMEEVFKETQVRSHDRWKTVRQFFKRPKRPRKGRPVPGSHGKGNFVMALIVGSHLICWLPLGIASLVSIIWPGSIGRNLGESVLHVAYYIACLNPFIYSIYNKPLLHGLLTFILGRRWLLRRQLRLQLKRSNSIVRKRSYGYVLKNDPAKTSPP